MFKIGTNYEFCVLEPGENGTYDQVTMWATVEAVDGALISLENGEIINTGSPLFHSATDKTKQDAFHKASAAEMEAMIKIELTNHKG
jgi:hypothetical protein